MSENTPRDHSSWDYTLRAVEEPELRRQAELTGRHLISRDTDVLNGVYGGAYGGEAIVVDYNKDPAIYDELIEEVKRRASEPRPDGSSLVNKQYVLKSIFDITREKMQYSQAKVDEIFSRSGSRDHKKIGLSVYIDWHAGVCRHQALLAASLLEILQNQGLLGGRASMERSQQWPEGGDPSGHSWVRYTNSAGEVYILDPAQDFFGTLKESRSRKMGWNYLRPDDKPDQTETTLTDTRQQPKLITSEDIPGFIRS
jgi:hypothetical protein